MNTSDEAPNDLYLMQFPFTTILDGQRTHVTGMDLMSDDTVVLTGYRRRRFIRLGINPIRLTDAELKQLPGFTLWLQDMLCAARQGNIQNFLDTWRGQVCDKSRYFQPAKS